MKAIVPVIFMICMFSPAVSSEESNPVTYHMSFENFEFLADDYVEHMGVKTREDRKLERVDGRFGKGLYLGFTPMKLNNEGYFHTYLDMITSLHASGTRKKSHYNEPFIWGSGRLHPAYGSVAFWVKGPAQPTTIFEQTTTSWGRTERQLIEIHLEKDSSISCYVEDARYVQHRLHTNPFWKADTWYHIVFMWDRSSGVELWINGEKTASSMGTDAWWDNQKAGLFHIPMAKATYDEFYTMNRPLIPEEIENLYKKNQPPKARRYPYPHDRAAVRRLKESFSTDTSRLPILRPSRGNALVFHEITPARVTDEGVSGWWIADGRYETAWPFEYGIYTDTPGDVDFHAEKADVLPPRGANINYVTLEGNLDGVRALQGDRNGLFSDHPVISVPGGKDFFYGAMIEGFGDSELRIPFTKEYGTPPGFQSDILKLPLSGDLRIHEVGIFNVSEQPMPGKPGETKLYINAHPLKLNDRRYPAALNALLPVIDRTVAGIYRSFSGKEAMTLTLKPAARLNLITEPFAGKTCFDTVILDMWVTSPVEDNILTVKLTNPAVPSHTWTHAEVRLQGFSGEPSRLRLALKFDPAFLVEGDRVWLQLQATDGFSVVMGDRNRPATVTLQPEVDWVRAELKFSYKTMRPNMMTYSGMFEWLFYRYTEEIPDVDAPENFGGIFDMYYPWQAVLKVNPGDRIANIYKDYAISVYNSRGNPKASLEIPHKTFIAPPNAPDWAVYFRSVQAFRGKLITWWRHNQRSDGQVGGGWNDDTLVFSRGYGDIQLDSNKDALILYNNVFDGFDKTNYFRDGYCRIQPIDDWHNGDFVRERYKSLVYNLGDPRSATWAMEEAWHWDKPNQTPVNFGDGAAFLFGKDVLEWYWNKRRYDKPYVLTDRERIVQALRRGADIINETLLWRFTEARVHTDDQRSFNIQIMHDMYTGGWGVSEAERVYGLYVAPITITVGVGWLSGTGPELGRFVVYSGNNGLRVEMYSFCSFDREVLARLFRLDNGDYRITLSADNDGDGQYETVVSEKEKHIKRFDKLSLKVPPQVPVLLDITQLKADPDPGPLPDLAVSDYYVKREGTSIKATIHNIGCAPTGPFTVSVLSPHHRELAYINVASLPGAEDFVPKQVEIAFDNLPAYDSYVIQIDKDDQIEEILEENNRAVVANENQ